jgi:hypothetical protein
MLALVSAPHVILVVDAAERPAAQLPLDLLPPSTAPPLTLLSQA